MDVEPNRRICNGCRRPHDPTGGGAGRAFAITTRREVEKGLPGAAIAPSRITSSTDRTEVSLKILPSLFGEFGVGYRVLQPVFWGERRRWRDGGLGCEGIVEGAEVGVAFLEGECTERLSNANRVSGVGFRGGCDGGGYWDGKVEA